MERKRNIIITSLLMGALALAHGGFDHVTGTVAKVAGNVCNREDRQREMWM